MIVGVLPLVTKAAQSAWAISASTSPHVRPLLASFHPPSNPPGWSGHILNAMYDMPTELGEQAVHGACSPVASAACLLSHLGVFTQSIIHPFIQYLASPPRSHATTPQSTGKRHPRAPARVPQPPVVVMNAAADDAQ
jgi:hypothetical protein